MNILGNISHNRIGTASEAVGKGRIYHHTEILGLINDDMGGFPDWIDFLNPLVQIGQCRQVVNVVFPRFHKDFTALFSLTFQKRFV